MFRKIRQLILDILFPIECLGCGQADVWLCENCLKKIPLNRDDDWRKLDLEPSFLDGFFVAAEWESKTLQEVIHKFKYNFAQELAPALSELLIKKMADISAAREELKNCVIVPVPLHKKRFAWRGFNQAEILASGLAQHFDLRMDNNLVRRVKYTKPQVKLSADERAKNIKEAFNVVKQIPKNILLVDDVITTGSTMNEIAKVLKQNGAEKVYGMAVARG